MGGSSASNPLPTPTGRARPPGCRHRRNAGSAGSRDWHKRGARTRSRRSLPKVLEPLGVASLGLATTDTDHVETFRAGLEGSDDCGSHAQHVPYRQLDDLVIELGATGPGDHNVDLLLHTMPVTPRHARPRVIGEAAHAELGRSQSFPREPPLHPNILRADITKIAEVLPGPIGHLGTFAPLHRTVFPRRRSAASRYERKR